MAHTSEAAPASRTTSLVTALRVTAALTVVVLAWQFVTAGALVRPSGASPALDLHQTGAIVLHVVSGLTMIAAALLWRAGAALWPTIVAALVFVLSFVQAYLVLPRRGRPPGLTAPMRLTDQRRFALMTPVSNPARCSPPWKRACSTLRQRSMTTVRPAATPRSASAAS